MKWWKFAFYEPNCSFVMEFSRQRISSSSPHFVSLHPPLNMSSLLPSPSPPPHMCCLWSHTQKWSYVLLYFISLQTSPHHYITWHIHSNKYNQQKELFGCQHTHFLLQVALKMNFFNEELIIMQRQKHPIHACINKNICKIYQVFIMQHFTPLTFKDFSIQIRG